MDSELMKINSNGVLTIPAKFRKMGFKTNGYVNVTLEEDGALRIIPVELIPHDQLGFHTPEWVRMEKKATQDLKTGKTKKYKSKDDFLKAMDQW